MSHADIPASSQDLACPAPLLRGLKAIVGTEHVISGEEGQRPFECDGLPVYRAMPMVTVLPADSEQVQSVLKLCSEFRVPVVTRGAGTGLSAGALPHPEGVLLVLSRLQRILDIDVDNQRMRVEPGVRNLAMSQAARPHGLYYAPDPSSQIACTIGGNVAENAGGIHCLKYGLTIHNLLAVRGFDADGEAFHLELDEGPGGANLLALLVGSEGMLAVVTEITVRLLPLPPSTRTWLAGFDSSRLAGEAVGRIIAAGIIPAALEMMDSKAIEAVEAYASVGYPDKAAAVLIIELDGHEDCVEADRLLLQSVLQSCEVSSLRMAANDAERERFWLGRKSAFPAVGRLSPDYYCMDGTIPRAALGDVLDYIAALSTEYALPVANVFHAGDGNLHPLILFDANVEGELARVEEMGGRLLEKCIAVGGTITGEHGVGLEKIRQMASQFSDAELTFFHALRRAFDPDERMNPGKQIPLLKHCQEYRALSQNRVPTQLAPAHSSPREDAEVLRLREAICDAGAEQRPLCVDGQQSKAFLGYPLEGEVLSTRHHSGILHYSPEELVIQARAGTTLAELEVMLAKQRQWLGWEPPQFGRGSLGGMMATGLAGPGRVSAGNVADQLLGCRVLTGQGDILRFGGRVMKNVAGFDVTRLLSGSMGTLGVILDITLRVQPKPSAELSLAIQIPVAKMSAFLRTLSSQSLPVTASCHDGRQLFLRLSAQRSTLDTLENRLLRQFSFLDISRVTQDDFWQALREQRLPFFSRPGNLWRIHVPAATGVLPLQGNTLYEWHGSLRWLSSDASPEEVFQVVQEHAGQAWLFRAEQGRADTDPQRLATLSGQRNVWYRRMKQCFDPHGILNHGRIYPGL